jgi:DNA-binding ferritin-like protein
LKFTFELDSEDKREMEKIKADCMEYYNRLISTANRLEEAIKKVEEEEKRISNSYQQVENLIDKYNKLLDEQKRKEKQINDKGLEDSKEIDLLRREIIGIRKMVSLPQPQKVYSNTREEFVT